MLSAREKKLLKVYRKLHNTQPSGFKMILMSLPRILAISSGALLAAVFFWPSLSARAVAPVWTFFLFGGVGAAVPLLSLTYLHAGQWVVVDKIIDWDRVDELLDETQEPESDSPH